MSSDDVSTLLGHQAQLEELRQNFDSWWDNIAQRVLPQDAVFQSESTPGQKRTERLFDSTAATACERFAAVMDDLLTPRTQKWALLKPQDDHLDDDQEVAAYLEAVNNTLFSMRYRPRANFPSQKHLGYLSIGAFGNSTLFIDEEVGMGPRYQHIHRRESYWAENQYGLIDVHYRKFKWEARKAVQRWGDKLPESIRTAAEKTPFRKYEFLHCVRPNEDRVHGRMDYRGMPWSSYYIAVEQKQMLDVGGFTSWPFAIGRATPAPGEVYGRGPAMLSWPAIMSLNEEKKSILRAGEKEVDPPVLLSEDGALEPFNLRPGALNHGLVSDQGMPLAIPFKQGSNIPLGLELMQLEQGAIEDAFLVTIFKVLVENPQMTATQVLEIAQQKAVLLAPIMGRQHSEDLGPLIERELDIAAKMGILPDMPDALAEMGGKYKIEYASPLARAMRAQDALAITRTFEVSETAISLDKTAVYVIDVPGAYRELAQINGVPAKFIRDDKTVKQMAAAAAQAEQAASLAAAAPDISQAALNAAKADQIRMGAPTA